MSEKTKQPRDAGKPRANRRPATTVELNDLRDWLTTLELGVSPSVKVNGAQYPTALVVVDLGQPLKQVRLNGEQHSELQRRLRATAKEILGGRDINIRVSADNSHGVHWACVA